MISKLYLSVPRKPVHYLRLGELRTFHGLTEQELAKQLNTQTTAYARYEQGLSKLPLPIALELATFYHVIIDYLIGHTNDRTPHC